MEHSVLGAPRDHTAVDDRSGRAGGEGPITHGRHGPGFASRPARLSISGVRKPLLQINASGNMLKSPDRVPNSVWYETENSQDTPPPTNRIAILLKATDDSADAADLRYVNSLAVHRGNWQAGWPVDLLIGNAETQVEISIKSDGAPEPDETMS